MSTQALGNMITTLTVVTTKQNKKKWTQLFIHFLVPANRQQNTISNSYMTPAQTIFKLHHDKNKTRTSSLAINEA